MFGHPIINLDSPVGETLPTGRLLCVHVHFIFRN